MLSLTDERLIALDTRKNGNDFKLFFKDQDGEPQIGAKDLMTLFDKEEIHFFKDDYSLKINEFKQLLEMSRVHEHPPDGLDIALHK